MLNYINWFSNNYKNSKSFRLDYKELLNSTYLTSKNLEDFSNPNYSLSKLDIFKYITVLEYLMKNNEQDLAYYLNPDLVYKFDTEKRDTLTKGLLAYNEILDINQYKNIIIDLFFLDLPDFTNNPIPLNILLGDETDKTQMDTYSKDLKELYEKGYGFEYFGRKSMSLFFMRYFKAFYKNIVLFSYNEEYLTLGKLLNTYSNDRLNELSDISRSSTLSPRKITLYSSFITNWNNLDTKGLDISTKILNDIMLNTSVEQLHFECKDFV